jgi:hypothetical protein
VCRSDIFTENIVADGVPVDPNLSATVKHKRRFVLRKRRIRRRPTQRVAGKRQSPN